MGAVALRCPCSGLQLAPEACLVQLTMQGDGDDSPAIGSLTPLSDQTESLALQSTAPSQRI